MTRNKVNYSHDIFGNPRTLREQAEARLTDLGFNRVEMEYCLHDWPEGDAHLKWLLTAPLRSIQNWVDSGLENA